MHLIFSTIATYKIGKSTNKTKLNVNKTLKHYPAFNILCRRQSVYQQQSKFNHGSICVYSTQTARLLYIR